MNRRLLWVLKRRKNVDIAKGYSLLDIPVKKSTLSG